MNPLADRLRLLALGQFRRQRAELLITRTRQQLQPLVQERAAFDAQKAELHSLLASHRANDCVLDHGQLLALLRRQAVIRRQIDLMRFERDRVDQQCREIEQALQEQREQLRLAQRKHDKYEGAVQLLLRRQRLEQVRRDEREVEEMNGVSR
ncbi:MULTISPECIES: type III secretion protein [Pseudomonas]|jgi:type III secretion system protein|uniref:Type III secretion protein n=1 Tax=Pseudomonas umsongensis TaxID=198618 RepID=A0AAE6ZX69_9PSED|nr:MULTISPECIES: type III secretion protein [Pseudomonas]KEX90182.1 type III secretion protein [Pseudomonas putida]MBT9570701.1 type III secretion protein [Pseudomonas umsongensis]OXR29710.1 type III secretion protein [Pseudomonas umsongensis]QJC80992.1 type III secretion protein [Pseudomonas umsongensis]SDT60903.1 surface presentation of antigen gene type M protein [Pseudomonas umsongensis]